MLPETGDLSRPAQAEIEFGQVESALRGRDRLQAPGSGLVGGSGKEQTE
jgi:hypothetical protein